MEKEEGRGDLLNLAIQWKRKEEEKEKHEKEAKGKEEEGGDLLNLVLKWKQRQVLEAGVRSSLQVNTF